MLKAGDPAPDFALPDADMEMVELASYLGKQVVLYFYIKDGTPGCTQEAIEFSDHEEDFARNDCVVVGVSRDDCIAHAEFRDNHGLSVALLSDTEGEVCRRYGAWQEKEVLKADSTRSDLPASAFRRSCVLRSTFVIDRRGIICHAFYGVQPRGHAAEILKLVRQLDKGNEYANRQEQHRHA